MLDVLKNVLEQVPNVNKFGLCHGRLEEGTADLAGSRHFAGEFERAVKFLERLPKRKTVNTRDGGSYQLKHVAERWAGDYVSNGALILAAIHCGFVVTPDAASPNGCLNIAGVSKWPFSDEELTRMLGVPYRNGRPYRGR